MKIKKILSGLYQRAGLPYKIRLAKGKMVCKKLGLNGERQYVICSHGIGDIVWMSSYLDGYLRSLEINDYILICWTRQRDLLRLYFPEIEMIGLEREQLLSLGHYVAANKEKYANIQVAIFPELKSPKAMHMELDILSKIGMEMDVCYKFGCFSLPYSAKFEKPIELKERAKELAEEKQLEKNNTVVLIPEVNSRMKIPVEIWERISLKLKENGFDVYTNVVKDTDYVLKGTKGLILSLAEMPSVVKYAGCVITARCGLGDWLFVNECDMMILHSYKSYAKEKYEQTQSNFGLQESFAEMQHRCKLEQQLSEYRIDVNGVDEILVEDIVASIERMLNNKR